MLTATLSVQWVAELLHAHVIMRVDSISIIGFRHYIKVLLKPAETLAILTR